jgi:drug/metabolite transporter (DMT)-like permease
MPQRADGDPSPRLRRVTALFALLSSALWGSADFVGGLVSRRLRPVVVVAVSQGLAFCVVAVWVVSIGAWHDPHGYLPWAAAAGVVGPLALVAFYGALASGTMGVVAPIAAAGVMVPVLIGLASGDRPSVLQYLGIALAVLGVILASGPELRSARGDDGPGPTAAQARAVVLALGAAVGFGFVLWFVARAGRTSVPMTIVTQRGVSTATMGVVLLITAARRSARPPRVTPVEPEQASLRTRDLPILAAVGLVDASANGFFAQASTGGLLAVVSVLGSLYPVATALLARVILKERLLPIQLKGVAVALTGIVLIGAGGGTG